MLIQLRMRIYGTTLPYATFWLTNQPNGEVLVRRAAGGTTIIPDQGTNKLNCLEFISRYYSIHYTQDELETCQVDLGCPVYEALSYGSMTPLSLLIWNPVRNDGEVAGSNPTPTPTPTPIPIPIPIPVPVTTGSNPTITWTPVPEAVRFGSETLTPSETSMPSISRHRRRRYLTLMPYSSFTKTAECLSDRDLRYMRVAALRVLRAMTVPPQGISDTRRKAIAMWGGDKFAICWYGMAIAKEMTKRGFTNTSIEEFEREIPVNRDASKPSWVFWPRLQRSHKSYLKLRGLRDAFVKRLHVQFELEAYTKGVREYLRTHDLRNIRNMSLSELQNLDPEICAHGHYTDEFTNVEAFEECVFPTPLQCDS